MLKKFFSLVFFLQSALVIDAGQLRTKLCLFLFHLLPDFYTLSPIKNFFLVLGGARMPIFGVYIKDPFYCTNLSNLCIGKGTFINTDAYIDTAASVSIGTQNQIGPRLLITTSNHDILNKMQNISSPVSIGNHCWLGAGVIFNPGSKTANHLIVGSGAVVSSFLETERALYVGIPAKLKKNLAQ